jgi:hypothetical protein
MLSNTGTISFIFYGVFIFIAFLSVIVVYRLLKNGTLESDKLDKLIDFFKTIVYTTALGTVALIVTDLFKEREQDIKELEYFDKYVQEVKEVNGEGRLQLSKYLSIVAPSGEMKKSWTAYYSEVKKEYDEYLKAQQESKTDTTDNPTKEQLQKREVNQTKIELFEKSLSMNNESSEWFILAGSNSNLETAKLELNKVLKVYPNTVIIKNRGVYRIVLRGYYAKSEAEKMLEEVKSKINLTSYIVNKNSWCKNIEETEDCFICK